jgi:ABC-type branched-subunit amino acid transport system substrate-binding protein
MGLSRNPLICLLIDYIKHTNCSKPIPIACNMGNRVGIIATVAIILISSTSMIAISQNIESRDHSIPNINVELISVKIGYLHHANEVYSDAWLGAAETAIQHSNSYQEIYDFELIVVNTNCGADSATLAAEYLVSEGVIAVSGEYCSASTINASQILNAHSIPMISFGSNLPSLSDDSLYPGLFRLTHSGENEGHVMSHSLNLTEAEDPALIYFSTGDPYDDDYRFAADGFWNARDASENPLTGELTNLCRRENETLDNSDPNSIDENKIWQIVQGIRAYDCDSVVLMAGLYQTAAIIDELQNQGWNGEIITGHWVANHELCNLTLYCHITNITNFSNRVNNSIHEVFEEDCSYIVGTNCSNYIQTEEIYDSIMIITDSFVDYFYLDGGAINLEQSISSIGVSWEGASGWITFYENGDSLGNGFDQCQFSNQSLGSDITPNCYSIRDGATAPIDTDLDGWSDAVENSCGSDIEDIFSIPEDFDDDTFCDIRDPDDDNDGVDDLNDSCPKDHAEYLDTDGDGICDNSDIDDDGDGYSDEDEENCNGGNPNISEITPDDFDRDMLCDVLDDDDDNDGCMDVIDDWPLDTEICLDTDLDRIGNELDTDDDGDGILDAVDIWPLDKCGSADFDNDGFPDDIHCSIGTPLIRDDDDDNDLTLDVYDAFPYDRCADTDDDGDGMPNEIVQNCTTNLIIDNDNDNDGVLNINDLCQSTHLYHEIQYVNSTGCGPSERDTDDDGIVDRLDNDVDGDGVEGFRDRCSPGILFYEINRQNSDEVYALAYWNGSVESAIITTLMNWSINWTSNSSTDFDGDGCNDDLEDFDDDDDGWNDADEYKCDTDALNQSSRPNDFDNDMLCDILDDDDDNDAIIDINDNCQFDMVDWISNITNDIDSDGCIDDTDDIDDDGDGWNDTSEAECGSNPLNKNSTPNDFDGDQLCDTIDDDDDNDGWPDSMDRAPLNPSIQTDLDVYLSYSKWIASLLILGIIGLLSYRRKYNK